jgi:hypothetical protein
MNGFAADISALESLAVEIRKISPTDLSKYQELLSVIRDPRKGFGWTGNDTKDRLVIFTERVETLKFLRGPLGEDKVALQNRTQVVVRVELVFVTDAGEVEGH